MANKYPTTPKSAAQTRRKGAIQTRSIFVFFDLGGTLVDLRGIVASMAERLTAVHTRGPVPLALRWAVTTSEAVRSYKPDPRIYRSALKALKARPSESLFVSDAALDLQGAARLGLAAAWIPRSLLPDLAKPPPSTLILSRIQDVDRIVTRHGKTGRFELR